ncbi:MAG: hypothetical protein ABIU85_10595, partial [Methylotenera sp.]
MLAKLAVEAMVHKRKQQANGKLKSQQEQVTSLSSGDENLARAIATAQERIAAIARRDRDLRSQAEEVRRQLDRAQQTLRWHQERIAQIEKELTTLTAQHEEVASQRQTIETSQAEAQNVLQAAESALEEAGA